MIKKISGTKKRLLLIRNAVFGKSVKVQMHALRDLSRSKLDDGDSGWLLETVLKYEKISGKD